MANNSSFDNGNFGFNNIKMDIIMKEDILLVRQTTNGKELYRERMNKYELWFKVWLSQRKPLKLDNQTLVLQLGIKSYKDLKAMALTGKLNKQDSEAIKEAIRYSEVN